MIVFFQDCQGCTIIVGAIINDDMLNGGLVLLKDA